MKWYLIEVAEGDSKIAGKAVYEYENKSDAVANFHSKLGNAMKSELFTSELVMVINSKGELYMSEVFVRTVEE